MKYAFVYLASPYSGTKNEMAYRHSENVRALAKFYFNSQYIVHSPIAQWHDPALHHHLPKGYEAWADQAELLIAHCDEVHILDLPGFMKSDGLKEETEWAEYCGIPIKILNHMDYTLMEIPDAFGFETD